MEPGALEDELTCAVCLQVYQDPVVLSCQHSFCLKCIEGVWAQTPGPEGFECPQCRQKFNPRPNLKRNFTLCNIVEKYNQSQPPADSARVLCEYCIENPSPAVKTCLKCKTSLCSLHLKLHLLNKTFSGHTLIEPLADLTERQCLDHKKVLEFYCKDDAECVCVSCTITGKHNSHTLLSLDQAQAAIKEELEREIERLRRVQQKCSSKQRDLERSEAEIKTRINELKGKLSKSFSEWRRQLEEDEEYALKLIDEEGLRALSQIRSCSEALNKRMEQITLIDGEIQNLVQRDHLSFIQVHLQYKQGHVWGMGRFCEAGERAELFEDCWQQVSRETTASSVTPGTSETHPPIPEIPRYGNQWVEIPALLLLLEFARSARLRIYTGPVGAQTTPAVPARPWAGVAQAVGLFFRGTRLPLGRPVHLDSLTEPASADCLGPGRAKHSGISWGTESLSQALHPRHQWPCKGWAEGTPGNGSDPAEPPRNFDPDV
ncbi:E3 ubiquitin/ISG15 ligase TRIM25-like [Heptranchias perlo]|uniref:E3 ubiquitin/ISG15 ligase TRIM25-like n=1 Tax=Heptranchias perlo TaxID=212740 RepID=UPI00355AA085